MAPVLTASSVIFKTAGQPLRSQAQRVATRSARYPKVGAVRVLHQLHYLAPFQNLLREKRVATTAGEVVTILAEALEEAVIQVEVSEVDTPTI